MRRSPVLIAGLAVLAVVAGALAAGPAATAAPGPGGDGLEVYVGELDPQQLQKLADIGVDREGLTTGRTADGKAKVEVIISDRQADKLRSDGVDLNVKKVKGRDASDEAARLALAGPTVFRPYSGPGGLAEELSTTAAANPALAKLVRVGTTVQGKPMLAVKVTKNARQTQGRPTTLGAVHGRPARARVDHPRDDPPAAASRPRQLRQQRRDHQARQHHRTVVHAGGQPRRLRLHVHRGNRLWRKNLRDNNGDGATTPGDGIDLNRNFATSGVTTTRARPPTRQ